MERRLRRGFDPSQFGDMGDLGDIFETFFGGGMGGASRRKTYESGSDLEVHEQITLEEAFSGTVKDCPLEDVCAIAKCGGKGAEPGSGFEKCSTCDGQGQVREQRRTFFGNFSQVKTCVKMPWRGRGTEETVRHLPRRGACGMADREIKIDIMAGIDDNQLIKVKGMGEAGERGTAAGDLYVRVRVRPSAVFARHGNDLIVTKELKLVDVFLASDRGAGDLRRHDHGGDPCRVQS